MGWLSTAGGFWHVGQSCLFPTAGLKQGVCLRGNGGTFEDTRKDKVGGVVCKFSGVLLSGNPGLFCSIIVLNVGHSSRQALMLVLLTTRSAHEVKVVALIVHIQQDKWKPRYR